MKYWIILNGVRLGPLTLDEALALPLDGATPVWRTGLPEWTTAARLPEFADKISGSTDVPPEPADVPPAGGYYPSYREPLRSSQEEQRPPMPDTYLPWAIVVTILCCLVTGIISLIYSSKVSALYNQGDYEGARRASSTALTWIWVSVVAGLILTPLGIMLQFASLSSYFE